MDCSHRGPGTTRRSGPQEAETSRRFRGTLRDPASRNICTLQTSELLERKLFYKVFFRPAPRATPRATPR